MRTRTSSKITDAFIFLDERWKMWPNRMKWRQMWGNICYRLQQTSYNHDFKSVCQWKRRIRIRTNPEPNWNHNIYQNKTNMIYFVLFSCCIISETIQSEESVWLFHHRLDSQRTEESSRMVSSGFRILSRTSRTARSQQEESSQIPRCVFASDGVRDVTSWRAECDIKPAPVHIIFNWLVL